MMIFRLDGSNVVHLGIARAEDCGPGSIIVTDCDGGLNPHHVAEALRAYCKSPVHVNCSDERQIASWQNIKAAMNDGPHAIADVRD